MQSMAAVATAAIFAASAGFKAYDLAAFRAATANYRILPRRLEALFALAVPVLEGGAALVLFLPGYRAYAALSLSLLLGAFTAAVAINLVRGRADIDCGCFGPVLRQHLSWWLVLRNGALFALLGVVLLPASQRRMQWLDFTTMAFGAATLILLYASANYLIANASRLRALRAVNA
jgi:hypothetical protein